MAANHTAVEMVKEMWGKHLNELNCHLHPLDTIATSCRSAFKSLEESKGQLYGKDCIAGIIVLQMNKLRSKDGKGFTTFLDDNSSQEAYYHATVETDYTFSFTFVEN